MRSTVLNGAPANRSVFSSDVRLHDIGAPLGDAVTSGRVQHSLNCVLYMGMTLRVGERFWCHVRDRENDKQRTALLCAFLRDKSAHSRIDNTATPWNYTSHHCHQHKVNIMACNVDATTSMSGSRVAVCKKYPYNPLTCYQII